jgi:uncharacterized protein (DUF433 family)
MNQFDRITSDPAIMNGQPCIRGMRLTVLRVLEALTVYPNWSDFRAEYPELELDDIRQALGLAASNLADQPAIHLEQLRTDIRAGTKSGSAGEVDIAAIKRKGRGRLVKTTKR